MLIFHTIPRWMPSRGLWPWGNTVGPPRSPRRKSTTRWSSSTPKRSHIWRICTPKWVENSKNILSILLITMLFHSSHLQVPSPNEVSFTTGTCQGEVTRGLKDKGSRSESKRKKLQECIIKKHEEHNWLKICSFLNSTFSAHVLHKIRSWWIAHVYKNKTHSEDIIV